MDMRRWMVFGLVLAIAAVAGAADPNAGFTFWGGAGDGFQELRLGYVGLLKPQLELAAGLRHNDLLGEDEDPLAVRGYAILHAIDAEMMATMLGGGVKLPDGTAYGGVFGEYRDDSDLAGGWLAGGLVDWPGDLQTFVEYGQTVWNVRDREYELMAGVRLRF